MFLYFVIFSSANLLLSEFIIPVPCSFVCSASFHTEHGQYVLSSTHGHFWSKRWTQACGETIQVAPAFAQAMFEARNNCPDSARCYQMYSENTMEGENIITEVIFLGEDIERQKAWGKNLEDVILLFLTSLK